MVDFEYAQVWKQAYVLKMNANESGLRIFFKAIYIFLTNAWKLIRKNTKGSSERGNF